MAKDVGIANDVLDEFYPSATIHRNTLKMHFDAMAKGTVQFDSDYTEIVKHQELQAGTRLREIKEDRPREELNTMAMAPQAQVKALEAENRALREQLQAEQQRLVGQIPVGAPRRDFVPAHL